MAKGSHNKSKIKKWLINDKTTTNTIKNRFYQKVLIPDHEDGCMVWVGSRLNGKRYGVFTINKKHYLAHRFSYSMHYGVIENNLYVLHKCDNEACVRPDHLFLGTQAENIKDRDDKKRGHFLKPDTHFNRIRFIPTGSKNPKAKLNESIVKEIREDKTSLTIELAKKYNVHKTTILNIKKNKTWRSI